MFRETAKQIGELQVLLEWACIEIGELREIVRDLDGAFMEDDLYLERAEAMTTECKRRGIIK